MTEFLPSILDFFLPRFCIHCNCKLTPSIKFLCIDCSSQIKIASEDFILAENEKKFLNQNIISDFSSAFYYDPSGPIHSLVHNLKYSHNFKSGIYLGRLAAENKYDQLIAWGIDIIIPVPLHSTKKAERGYNQSDYISKGISDVINSPVNSIILKRKRFTESQTGFDLLNRKANMKDAFKVKSNLDIEGKNILLVDDVITTGATITSCAEVLKEKKAKNIFAFSVAIPFNSTSFLEQIHQELQDHF